MEIDLEASSPAPAKRAPKREGGRPKLGPFRPGDAGAARAARERAAGRDEEATDTHEQTPPEKPATSGDPRYNADAPINREPSTTYAEAMRLRAARELRKPVLTEQGWVVP
jgi:hypothetical protein